MISMLRVALLVGLFAPRCASAEAAPSDLPPADRSNFARRITLGPGPSPRKGSCRLRSRSLRSGLCMHEFTVACLGLLLAFSTGGFAAHAQSSSWAWSNGSSDLNDGWRTHAGDDPAWAQPGFNDSSWPSISLTAPNDFAGWRWYRLRVLLPQQHRPLALLIIGGGGTYEVYINGERLSGPQLLPPLQITLGREQFVSLPDSAGDIEISLRTCIPPTSMFVADRGAWRVRIGTLAAMDEARRAMLSERLNATLPNIGIGLVVFLAGIPLLLLFWWQPDHREYLWLGLYLISVAIGDACYYIAMFGFVPFSVNWFGGDPNGYLATIAQIEFIFSFAGKRVTRAWRIYEALLLTIILTLQIPAWLGSISRGLMNLAEVVLMVPASLCMLVLLLIWYSRGNRETGWLILPAILPIIGILVTDLGIAAAYLGWSGIAWIRAPLHVGVLTVEWFQIANLLFLLAIGFVMFFRFTRVSRDQARGAAELEAAQRVQALLLRSSQERVPGLTIETVYRPAQEVGGDFFHTAQEGEVVRVVIGDVSGKGLGAAMLVSAVVGALDTLHDSCPSRVLRTLNALLLARQQGGFATCVCACIAQDGAITFANAGHLAPYCGGEEVSLESGLPLGIAAVAEYAETTFQLNPGDRLTFLSDGVVEAQSTSGELFGFERTTAISTKSAEQIAAAAQAHGQEDDITVLTLQRTVPA